MGIPVPCRDPQPSLDYGVKKTITALQQGKTEKNDKTHKEGNRGAWSCDSEIGEEITPFCCFYSPLAASDFCPFCEKKAKNSGCEESKDTCETSCSGTWCDPNDNSWSYPTLDTSKKLLKTKSLRSETQDSITAASRKETFFVGPTIDVDGEKFDISLSSKSSGDYCNGAGDNASCYPVCCDSVYATTEFCRSSPCF